MHDCDWLGLPTAATACLKHKGGGLFSRICAVHAEGCWKTPSTIFADGMPVEKSSAVCLCRVCLRFLYEPKPKQWCAQLHGILQKPLQCLLWFNLACQVKFQAEASLQIAHSSIAFSHPRRALFCPFAPRAGTGAGLDRVGPCAGVCRSCYCSPLY